MVIHAFPAAKLGALLLKQVSKPIATWIKERAKGHPFFRTYVCMPPAHFYNWCEVKMKMWILNLGKPVNIPQLNDAMAIDLGANILGEAIIFIIAAGILFLEYSRQMRKEEKKESARKEELSTLHFTIQELYFQLERQDAQIRELHRNITDLEGQVLRKPWKPSSGKTNTLPPKDPPAPPALSDNFSNNPPTVTQSNVNSKINNHQLLNKFIHSKKSYLDNDKEIHLEHINKLVGDNPGIILNAVAYLSNEVFNFHNDVHYTKIHIEDY